MSRRLPLVLLALLVVLGIDTALKRHLAREQFAELESMRAEARALDEAWGRLLLERATLANHARIDELARTDLKMRSPERARLVVVRP